MGSVDYFDTPGHVPFIQTSKPACLGPIKRDYTPGDLLGTFSRRYFCCGSSKLRIVMMCVSIYMVNFITAAIMLPVYLCFVI